MGLDVSRNAINVHSDMSTNIPGVYAVGGYLSEGKCEINRYRLGEVTHCRK